MASPLRVTYRQDWRGSGGSWPPSMGPPPFGDGNSTGVTLLAARFRQLQWGHRLSAMETPKPGPDASYEEMLQWGHRLSAMETFQTVADLDKQARLQWGHRLSAMETSTFKIVVGCVVIASMGPPPFGDGNTLLRWTKIWERTTLQWGHRLSAMETWLAEPRLDLGDEGFNGATAFRRWKQR